MAIQKISIEELIAFSGKYPVLDVRSPSEFGHAHFPGATSFPIFTDEERKVIGTAYKQESRKKAIKHGLDFFGVKMRAMVELAEKTAKEFFSRNKLPPENALIVHCWRGGMRSAAVAWLLDLYGYDVYLLEGGYKFYRNWVLEQFEKEYRFNIVGGFTGSGKTELLKILKEKKLPVIDLEGIANHKGSAFGALGQPPQPSQEMFENLLAHELYMQSLEVFWLEDESQRIGALNIPHGFWKRMRTKQVFFLDIPFEERLDHITKGYGSLEKEKLADAILRIQKRLGPLETKTAIALLSENNMRECFRILLSYYDKTYIKGLNNRENLTALLNKISCSGVDALANTEKLLSCNTINA